MKKSDVSVVAGSVDEDRQILRQELLEVLDRIVSYEHYYRSVYGHFTMLINRLGPKISKRVMSEYDIRIETASSDRLLINALSEKNGKIVELVSVDQNFQIHSNFSLPVPRPQYIKIKAMKHLRCLREGPEGIPLEEESIYKGYFEYNVRTNSDKLKSAFALGVKAPVVGVKIELNADNYDQIGSEFEIYAGMTGESKDIQLNSNGEQEYFAQRIFLGEIGRYAKDWSELSKITHLELDGIEKMSDQGLKIEKVQPSNPSRNITSIKSTNGSLVIESLEGSAH